ncbi:MAG: hypothetical protein G01um101448_134 [Parcubacteria group bacterium Gr01-1014_48]|nr:MAG: hypothetical protein Greene041614_90 [Parcubacteria group bacterium Greene0416_14]TSC74407.1 MAG: hypothetical protein G01um101448_134 [Parcubacteria group bacterium Gr01-1014_48]TSD01261.1 MAG: hypothetical protein Greene101415_350 [Parcubacteria group bacterium Greene1014_15]
MIDQWVIHSLGNFVIHSKERMDRGDERMVYTGTHEDLSRLVSMGDHDLILGVTEWDGYVPFSNGYQYGYPLGGDYAADATRNGEPISNAAHELRYVTTLGDVLEAFGILPKK